MMITINERGLKTTRHAYPSLVCVSMPLILSACDSKGEGKKQKFDLLGRQVVLSSREDSWSIVVAHSHRIKFHIKRSS
jgi:hypothetical protein